MNGRHRRICIVACAIATAFFVGYLVKGASAQGIPTTTPLFYSGRLEQNGSPLTGDHVIEVDLWTDPTSTATGARACATLPVGSTAVSAGRFRVALDSTCLAAVHANPDLWAQVSVDGTALPRTKLGAVPFAVEADHASSVTGPGGSATWTVHRTAATTGTPGSFADVPGLSTNVDLAHSAMVNLLSSGAQRQLPSSTTECEVAYRLVVDGTPVGPTGQEEHVVVSTSAAYWSEWTVQGAVQLAAGTHTVSVQAKVANPTCAVCGDVVGGSVTATPTTDCVLSANAFYQ